MSLSPISVKLVAWCDSEWGYANQVVELLQHVKITVDGAN